jgi:hypothetical protein
MSQVRATPVETSVAATKSYLATLAIQRGFDPDHPAH